jgi:hypothetical protein
MSFAVLYLRLLPGTIYRRLNQVLLVLLLAQGLEESLVVIFRCNPVDKAWTPSKKGHCLDLRSFYYTSVRSRPRTLWVAQMLIVVVRYQARDRYCPICSADPDGLEDAAI